MWNLEEVNKSNTLYYWCNACGDINVLTAVAIRLGTEDDLPRPILRLYNEYWGEGRGVNEYCVSFNGEYGLMLGMLFDYSWLNDLGLDSEADDVKAALHSAVRARADRLEAEYKEQGKEYQFFYGQDTDPDGDEILIFIPAEELFETGHAEHWINQKDSLVKLSDGIYSDVEKEIKRILNIPESLPEGEDLTALLLSILRDAVASAETIRDKEDSIWEEDKQIVRYEIDELLDNLLKNKAMLALLQTLPNS